MSYECEECEEEFETLTRMRLHDCPDDVADESPESSESDEEGGTERERPMEVEMGLEPEYDCPECDYYSTGVTTSPHAFLDHLQDEHGYSSTEAHKVLNG